jgi:type I restriction enzyme S subunit
VTKGCNPKVKLIDSRIKWVGNIPEHWEKIKINKIICSSELGGNYSGSTENDGIPLIKMGNIGRGEIVLDKLEYIDKSEVYDKNHILKKGDFLFNTRNSKELVGKVTLWNEELEVGLFNSNILRINFNKNIDNRFISYLFNSQSYIDCLNLISKGTTSVSAIYFKDLSQIDLCIPPYSEQKVIVDYLDVRIKEIKDLVSMEQKKIDLLKEYRQSLITEVITGKIDVRTNLN